MRTAVGLERLLLAESNISDLIQYLAIEDHGLLSALLGVPFDEVQRETWMGGRDNRADLVLRLKGRPVAAIELKVAHEFGSKQQNAYEAWAAVNGEPVLVLSSLDSAPANLSASWNHYPLAEIFKVWTHHHDPFSRSLARRVAHTLQKWGEVVEGVRRPITSAGALTFADVDNIALLRVISRELSAAQAVQGVDVWVGVSSGGGGPIAMSFTPVEGVENLWFVADARFEDNRVHLRFGIDGRGSNAADVWRVACAMDAAITVSALAQFVDNAPGATESIAKFEAGGRGRPKPRGDWSSVIAAGKLASGANPGFLRDGLTRLECGGRLLNNEVNSWSLQLLMAAAHQHLLEAWSATNRE